MWSRGRFKVQSKKYTEVDDYLQWSASTYTYILLTCPFAHCCKRRLQILTRTHTFCLCANLLTAVNVQILNIYSESYFSKCLTAARWPNVCTCNNPCNSSHALNMRRNCSSSNYQLTRSNKVES